MLQDYEDKITKLKAATQESARCLAQQKATLDDATQRLAVAKALLQQMDAEDQERIVLNDTPLPECIAMHQLAKDRYETTQKRHQTNLRYLQHFQSKAADSGK